ncbi:MAG: hypothetical protein RLZ45_1073 [Verrucomicrobiota bacterium]
MLSRLRRPLLCGFLLLLAVAGCSDRRERTGQVFLVTPDGSGLKLALVGIHVVPGEELARVARQLLKPLGADLAGRELLLGFDKELRTMASHGLAIRDIERIGGEAVRRRTALEAALQSGALEEDLLTALPPARTRTDADGLFAIEALESDWLVARWRSGKEGPGASVLWLFPLAGTTGRLLVSGDSVVAGRFDLLDRLQQRIPQPERQGPDPALASWIDRSRQEASAAVETARGRVAEMERELAGILGVTHPFVPGAAVRVGALSARWIPAGRFTMGSPNTEEGRFPGETPHEVVLSRGFFMAETECTQRQWQSLMGSNPSGFQGPDLPVEQVSWNDAVEFCRRLTELHRREGRLATGWEWRLPTEAEWEYAARAGNVGPRHGNLDAIAWHEGNSGKQTHPVGGRAPNEWGLHDTLGNVFEWCLDWQADYISGPQLDPKGPESGSSRVGRGGSWSQGPRKCRFASRNSGEPLVTVDVLGFRPALCPPR